MASTALVTVASSVMAESTKVAIVALQVSPNAEMMHHLTVHAVFPKHLPSVLQDLCSMEMDCA
jgi:hypothetical protein